MEVLQAQVHTLGGFKSSAKRESLLPFRTLRQVKGHSEDKTVVDEEVSATLVSLFTALLKNDLRKQREILSFLTAPRQAVYLQTGADAGGTSPSDTMLATLGFSIGRRPSSLPLAGTGVFVTKGLVQKGTVVAMYPGTVYQLHEPILLPSIGNPFVFRCIDGVLIDGNDKNISRIIYRSCSGRDRLGPFALSDVTWLTASPQNPLAVGQYVNNSSNEMPANVCYQEYDVPEGFPLELHQYLPNVNYRQESGRPLRCVVLVSLKEIQRGEELFSNYYTIVR
ncbi:SET domain-containing protein 9 isoform X2 [Denticeps clupeoides]|uniref:SET domain-containing protein 9 isoform X2 n=1 Tax=Denticeps clupeoides TaxID=299321 RepID=UPI0010A3778D|nr:SET domain-containing protein 9 isoform X2 [Denticeps clupeoides]XP_028837508.1 SET domain-containing protein 9 isoform X2 [Denticeps clupeoides]XP_028837509.1 SET domain-containing protein 9 isoform X2 [Denticeps clupeoides]